LLIVLSGFLGIGRACSDTIPAGLKYDFLASFCRPASLEGNIWATLHTFEQNNLAGMALIA